MDLVLARVVDSKAAGRSVVRARVNPGPCSELAVACLELGRLGLGLDAAQVLEIGLCQLVILLRVSTPR